MEKRKEVLEELNDNDIFLLPSLWEGLPISLLEAMYLKKICIVSNCIGNRDVIENNENGYVINNIDEGEKILKEMLENKKGYDLLCEKAYKNIYDNYIISNMVMKYKNSYAGE